MFVSLDQENAGSYAGVAVLERADGAVAVRRVLGLRGSPSGMALTHDGKLLVLANGANIVFLDAERMTTGTGNPVLGYWREGHEDAMSVYVNVTADDRYLLVSNESVGTISMIDLAQARRSHFAQVRLVGSVPVGDGPIGLAFSSDERFLFATVQAVSAPGWNNQCKPEGSQTAMADHPKGAVVVIDMKLAASDAGKSVLRRVPAGCNPVRVVASRQTGHVYVTARGSNELLEFTERELTSPGHDPQPTHVTVGASPVGVAVIENGRRVVVASSDRFSGRASSPSLYVIDSARIAANSRPVVGIIPSRGFPREIHATADGQTLLVTNFSAGTLQIVDLNGTARDLALHRFPPTPLASNSATPH
jgi:DNA-binding beta-propeller fold protein YncE